jgi:peptide/nickel transport system substrate-binding protein
MNEMTTDSSPQPPVRAASRTRRAARARGLLVAAAACAVILAACGGSSASTSSSNGSGSSSASGSSTTAAVGVTNVPASDAGFGANPTTSQPTSSGVLHLGVLDAPQVLDPHEAGTFSESYIADNISDKLTWQDPTTGKLFPWLATRWSYNRTFTKFTFQLRHDVTFSNGQPFTSASVKANFDQDAFGNAKLQITPDPTHWTDYARTVTPNKYEAIVEFSKPNAGFLTFTAFSGDNDPGFVADSTLSKSKTQRLNPANVVGTGPFVIKSYKYQQDVVLVRRQGYHWAPAPIAHNGPAYLSEVDLETIPEASVRTGALESGKLQATLDVQPTDESSLKSSGYQIIYRPIAGENNSFVLNADLFPTNDLAVRKAINLGWNPSSLFGPVLSPSYRVATSVIADNVPGYVDYSKSALHYDPAAAKALLQADGWKVGQGGFRYKDGKELTIKMVGTPVLVANQSAFELMQEQLKQIGINEQLTILPVSDFGVIEDQAKTKWNGNAGNTSRDDPSVLWQVFSPAVSNSSFVEPGTSAYKPLVTTLQDVQSTLDPAARAAATAKAQQLILQKDALVAPVYVPSQVIAASKDVHGIVMDSLSRALFYDTWIGKQG